MAPDGMHLHSLVFRRVAMPIERRASEHWAGERREGERRRAPPADGAPPRVERRREERRRADRRGWGMTLARANARVAPRMWLHGALCFALAVLFHDNTPALWISLLVYAAFYVSRYRALVRFGRRRMPLRAAAGRGADVAKPPNVF
jgi:hypothetical protein